MAGHIIVGVPWICMRALDEERVVSITRQIDRDLIALPLERQTLCSLLELATPICADPPAAAQFGLQTLGHREEDMFSELNGLL